MKNGRWPTSKAAGQDRFYAFRLPYRGEPVRKLVVPPPPCRVPWQIPVQLHAAPASVRNPPSAQLPQNSRFAANRHLARPLSINPKGESSPRDKGQIDQFDFELGGCLQAANDHAAMRFDLLVPSFTLRASRLCRGLPVRSIGTGHAPFYKPKANKVRKKSKSPVPAKMRSPVHLIPSTSSLA
jgi:hypothetical protein